MTDNFERAYTPHAPRRGGEVVGCVLLLTSLLIGFIAGVTITLLLGWTL